ncbi:MAG: hypothetical protein KGP27_00805 [Hyphomicrobiales bacterium]|nr:hypothetical protein [Hyphomicrobiales bacterium]
MARTTRQLSGAGKDKFLRSLVARAASGSADPASIAEALAREITEVRVRRETWETLQAPSTHMESAAPPAPIEHPDQTTVAHSQSAGEPAQPQEPIAETAPHFDPFAFSAVAVLTRKGRPGLAQALDTIGRAEDLRRLAEAQHLVLPDGLADVALLREAVIAAAERRIAERRAAAS